MSSDHAIAKLAQATKDLHVRWQATRDQWSDPVAEAFESDCIEPIDPITRRVMEAAMQIETQMQRARRDCS